MYRHRSRSTSHKGLLPGTDGNTRATSASEDREEHLVDSARLRRSGKGAGRNIFTMKSGKSLRLLSLCFHCMLVVIHLALIPVWFKKLENRVVFALKYQSTSSFLITAVTQTFGTVYLAALVLVTQKLSMRRNLVTAQPLTATHDSTAAWAGIGSALLHLWRQKAVRASFTGVLSVFLYLGTVLVLHITTPGLFSLETFNSTTISVVHTEGLPAINMSGYNGTTSDDLYSYVWAAQGYIQGSLYYLPYVDGSTSIGLTAGTLYNVPETNAAIGTITVAATGFNVTCEFLEDLTAHFDREDSQWFVSSGKVNLGPLETTQPRVISVVNTENIFYSTIPIIDSNNNTGGVVRLDPPMNSTATVSSVQLFQCFLSLVEQTAVLDAGSKKMVALHPEIVKNTSTWHPGNPDQTFPTTGNPLLDRWWLWYFGMPPSDFPRDPLGSDGFFSVADLYLIQKFNLHSANQAYIPGAVTLHDLENALSELVATMFWTIGHIAPTHEVQIIRDLGPLQPEYALYDVESPVMLLPSGNTTATEQSLKIRLNLNIIAVSIGLAGSVVLMLLSLQHSLLRTRHEDEHNLPIDGTGLLHAIWLYRNHPELELLLDQVAHPTDDNLRHAGMVRIRLVGPRSRETENMDSAPLHSQVEKCQGFREVVLASLDSL
ncbi:hypothetical protein MVEN_01103400 [Mycena venus]|uniref:Transmembrane protein n=1 Tax=Mycena venus TaxID=2733690 RepID=A0A8H6Y6H3_9AGAR|nr:hypothetical protein MVEN_01103400 [Mycena venus]